MMTQPITESRILSALVIAIAMGVFFAQPAAAQTAGNLQCNGCVSSKEIKNKGIKRNDIKNNAITGAKVRDSSLTGLDLAIQSIPAGDLSNGAGGDFNVNPTATIQGFPLTPTDTVYRTVNLTVPSAGEVILNATGIFSGTGNLLGFCSISKTAATDQRTLTLGVIAAPTIPIVPFGIAWAESVATAGTQTWNLVCQGAAGLSLGNPALTAIFVPTRY